MERSGIILHPEDDVVVALEAVSQGDIVVARPLSEKITALEDIQFGHKLARHDLTEGQTVLKYGNPMGRAVADIKGGAHAHVHNLSGLRIEVDQEKRS